MNVLTVHVRGKKFGIPSDIVVEVLRAVAVSPLPGAPAVISGVINVRGSLTPVMDPAIRFGDGAAPLKPSDNFVLVAMPSRIVALRVDSADELEQIDDADVSAAASVSSSAVRLAGVATLPDGLIVIYDPASFLDEAESRAVTDALASATI